MAANITSGPLRARSRVDVEVLRPRSEAGTGQVLAARLLTTEAEAAHLADWIAHHWLDARGRPTGTSAAVLCRKRSQFGAVIEALEGAGLPVEVVGLGGLLGTPEVSDIVALLWVVQDPTRGDQLMRLLTGPWCRLGAADLEGLAVWSKILQRRQAARCRAARPHVTDQAPDSADRLEAALKTLSGLVAAYPGVQHAEEAQFRRTLANGLKLLDEATGTMGEGGTLPGATAFKLYDTFGFPYDLTEDALRARGMAVDRAGFDVAMAEQKAAARAAWKGSGERASDDLWFDLVEEVGSSEFTGYSGHEGEGVVLALVKDGARVETATEGDNVSIILNQTPFYAESGGQVGDAGVGLHLQAEALRGGQQRRHDRRPDHRPGRRCHQGPGLECDRRVPQRGRGVLRGDRALADPPGSPCLRHPRAADADAGDRHQGA